MKQLVLSPLPYSYDALEPVISRQIMELHHDKHHAAYVNAANAALEKLTNGRQGKIEINTRETMRDFSFNANGAMLHEIFWKVMHPVTENNQPQGKIKELIESNYGDFESFQKEFTQAAIGVEGSGWAVVWKVGDELVTGQLEKHNLLAVNGARPILVLDVWEHAYYLQYLNNRAEYVKSWWQLVNWDEVALLSS